MVMAARQFPSTSDMSPKPATQAASDAATHGHTSVIDQHVYGTECLPRGDKWFGQRPSLAGVAMSDDTPKPQAPIAIGNLTATSATSDEQLVASWIANLRSAHSRVNFETTARRFVAALDAPLRRATVEDV